jgi:hypothetical protein
MGFMVDKAALLQVFSDYLGFPCHSFHRLLYAYNQPLSWAGTIGHETKELNYLYLTVLSKFMVYMASNDRMIVEGELKGM